MGQQGQDTVMARSKKISSGCGIVADKGSYLAGLITALCAANASLAATQWPPSIIGTWTGVSDTTSVTITITSQATAGEACKAIKGKFAGDALEGYYCPSNGQFSFARLCPGDGAAAQIYAGSLADGVTAHRATGTFSQVTSCFGAAGDFSFWMQK